MSEVRLEGPILLDLTEVGKPVAEGWHVVQVERCDPGYSRKQQIPQLFVVARVVEENDPDVGSTVIWNSQLAGNGLIFTKRAFAALGLPLVLEYEDIQALCDDILDRVCEVRVKYRMYQGEKTANVTGWRALQMSS